MKAKENNKIHQSGDIKTSTLRVIRAGGKHRHKGQDIPELSRWEGGNMFFMERINLKGGKNMKTKRNIRRSVLIVGVLVLMFAFNTVPAALAQGSPDISGWHAGMAMATLAEKENRVNEQKLAEEHDVAIAQSSSAVTGDTKEYQQNQKEKDITGE
jgi:hypothetical protein